MRKIFFFIFILLSFAASAQYVPNAAFGYQYQRVKPIYVLHIPVWSDTNSLHTTDTSAQIGIYQGTIYYHWGYYRPINSWSDLGLRAIYAGNCLTKINDSTLALDLSCVSSIVHDSIVANYFDSLSLSNRINLKQDTTYRTVGKDSIQFTIGGRYHAIKDSIADISGKLNISDTSGHWIYNVYKRVDSFFYAKNGVETFIGLDVSGTGSTNSNIGAGYRWAIPNTNNIKTAFGDFAITIDSITNANSLTYKLDTSTTGIHTENYYNTKYLYTASNGITLASNNFKWGGSLVNNTTIAGAGFYTAFNGGRLEAGQGAAIAAANNLTLGADGNTFSITGATQINAITTSNWQAGSTIDLIFTSTPVIKHNTAGGAGTATILLAGGQDYTAGAGDDLTLKYDGTNWHQTALKIAAASGLFWPRATANLNGTLLGQDTIISNTPNQLYFKGVYTATANNQYHIQFSPTATARATASDNLIGLQIAPTLASAAVSQNLIALDIAPTYSDVLSVNHIAIREAGQILPATDNVYSIGSLSFGYNSAYIYAWHGNSATVRSGTGLTIKDENGLATAKFFVPNSGTTNYNVAGFQVGSSSKITSTSNGPMIEALGSIKGYGGLSITKLTTPVIASVVNIGTIGGTTYTYKVVAVTWDGIVTNASAAVSTATGKDTLTISAYNRITITEVTGARSYYVYRTVGGATQGKIATATLNFVVDDTGLAGDGATASAVNNTGAVTLGGYGLGVHTGTPTYALTTDASGNVIESALSGGTPVTSVSGTANRITSTGGTAPVIDIDATFEALLLKKANNLSDVASVSTSRTNLGGTTIGQNLFTLTNPSALGYLRVNADNTVTHRTYANVKTDLGLVIGTDVLAYSANVVYSNQANTYTAGMKQTFQADATNAGLSFGGVTANPSSLATGNFWYRSDENKLRYYDGTTIRALVSEALTQTLTNKTIDGSSNTLSNIGNSSLSNSTISGIALGSNLAALTATDATLTFSGSYTGATARTVGLNLGNANTWTALQTHQFDALGTTVTDALLLQNSTAAANNAQQISPSIHFKSFGWGITAGTSQSSEWRIFSLPVQSASALSNLTFQTSVNGAAYVNQFQLRSDGFAQFTNQVQTTSLFNAKKDNIQTTSTDGVTLINNQAAVSGTQVQQSPRIRWTGQAWNTGGTPAANIDDFIAEMITVAGNPTSAYLKFSSQINAGGYNEVLRIADNGKMSFQATNTTVGTTGNQTINKTSGTVNIAAAGTTVTVTNSLVSATSLVFAVIRTNDATARIANVVPAAGSFVINIVACTAEVSIGFFVIN